MAGEPGLEFLDDHYLLLTFLMTVTIQLSCFAIAFTLQIDKITDIAGSLNFLVLSVITLVARDTYYTRQIVVCVLISVWALRLGLFLLYRVLLRGHDARFDKMRGNCLQFLGFWVFQIVWVWVVSLGGTFLNSAVVDTDLGMRDYIGWGLWGLGFFFEVAADHSKQAFYNNPESKGKLLQTGVWSISRHPNYFGEIVMWLGIWLSASSVFEDNTKWGYVSVLSPVITYVLLMHISGIPLTEDRYDKRYGASAEYLDYKKSVSPLIPLPRCLYRALPGGIKTLFFCEYARYSRVLRELGASEPMSA